MSRAVVAASLLCLATAPAALAQPQPAAWTGLAEVQVIEVVTVDEDGDLRETPVWFVLVGDEAYLRTNDSRWYENIVRGSPLRLRVEGLEFEQRAEVEPSDAVLQQVDSASLEKYGWQERVIHAFRTSRPNILRLLPPG